MDDSNLFGVMCVDRSRRGSGLATSGNGKVYVKCCIYSRQGKDDDNLTCRLSPFGEDALSHKRRRPTMGYIILLMNNGVKLPK